MRVERKTGAATLHRLQSQFASFRGLALEAVSPCLVEKWQTQRRQAGKAASTINRDVVTLKAVLSKAVVWEWLVISPLAKLKPLKIDSQPIVRYLTEAEEQRLLDALARRDQDAILKRASANVWRTARGYELFPSLESQAFCDHLTPMVLLALHTGLRRGELLAVCWEQVHWQQATITVRGDTAKSGKTRHVPLNSIALAALKNWYAQSIESTLVFPNRLGESLGSVRKAWGKVLKEAGINHFRWHDLRHHFASRLVMAGVDLNTTRELLGHSDLKVTLRYAHLAPEHKAEAVSRLVKFKGSNIQAISQY